MNEGSAHVGTTRSGTPPAGVGVQAVRDSNRRQECRRSSGRFWTSGPLFHGRRVLATALALAALAFAGCATTAPVASEPLNLSVAKEAAIAYAEGGRYDRDLADVAREARAWLAQRAARRAPGERLAVVFDLDETLLSNYRHMRSQDFGYVPYVWHDWVARAEAPSIAPVKAVYDDARRLGLAIFFVTGRQEPRDRTGTEANLRREGLGHYERLVLAADDGSRLTTAQRKAAVRAAIEAEGYRIVANLGDQPSDLEGGHAERTFKLPNPFYLIP